VAVKPLANNVFSTLALNCPKLLALVIACWRRCSEYDAWQRNVHCYLKATQIDVFGRISVVAVDSTPAQIRSVELCSDIVEPERFLTF
jgi:hypothetical protein